MIKSKRFQPIQEIAASSAHHLSRAMADAGLKVTELERQFGQLESYRDEYARKSAAGGAIDAVRLQNSRSFLDRLGEALRQNRKTLAIARMEYEKRRAEWSEKRVEAESLSRVVDRCRLQEKQAADEREQREVDERVSAHRLARDLLFP
jgi:flagellar export protein FliJ